MFLGNLPFDADEEDVRRHFAEVLDSAVVGGSAVEAVRIVRDALTQVPVADLRGPLQCHPSLCSGSSRHPPWAAHGRNCPLVQRGKGFGYVLLTSKTAAAQALQLHDSVFAGRRLRVMTCGKRFKGRRGAAKDEEPAPQGRQARGEAGQGSRPPRQREGQPKSSTAAATSLPFQGRTAATGLTGAARRISQKLKR